MKTAQIIGLYDAKGSYEGHDFHNYYLTCSFTPDTGVGTNCQVLKVSERNLLRICERYNVSVPDLIGMSIPDIDNDVFRDSYKRISMIILC